MRSSDIYQDGVLKRRVDELKVGDRVDLEGDIFADPSGGATDSITMGDTDHPEFAFQFEMVATITLEPHDVEPCIAVEFESGLIFGFPPDHMIEVDAEQDDE